MLLLYITRNVNVYIILMIKFYRYQKEPTTHTIGLQSPQDHCIITDLSLLKHINPSIRTKCFFEIEIQGDQKLGSIHFELYDDIVPRTCTNFAELCRGYNGLSYK